jgi:hypothetical protein
MPESAERPPSEIRPDALHSGRPVAEYAPVACVIGAILVLIAIAAVSFG